MEIVKVFAFFAVVKSAAVTFEGSGREDEGRVSAIGISTILTVEFEPWG